MSTTDPADAILEGEVPTTPITRAGDLWLLGKHRLLCGSALLSKDYELLLGAEKAELIFSDPPYNLAVSQVSGLGKTKHSEFAVASGELSANEFVGFLVRLMVHLCGFSVDGSIHFAWTGGISGK